MQEKLFHATNVLNWAYTVRFEPVLEMFFNSNSYCTSKLPAM